MIVHLIADVHDRATLCGARERGWPALPYLHERYREQHRQAHERAGLTIEFCEACQNAAPFRPATLFDLEADT